MRLQAVTSVRRWRLNPGHHQRLGRGQGCIPEMVSREMVRRWIWCHDGWKRETLAQHPVPGQTEDIASHEKAGCRVNLVWPGRLESPVVPFHRPERMMVQCFRAGHEQSTFAAVKNLFRESFLASLPLPEYQLEIWERMWVSTEEVFSLPCKLLSSCYRPSSHELKVCLGNEEREKKGTTGNAAAIKIKN